MEAAIIRQQRPRTYVGKMEARMNFWGAKLGLLAVQAAGSKAAVSGGFPERIDLLILKHRAARSRLEELRSVGADKFDALSNALDTSWRDLEGAIKDLTARFKETRKKE